MQAWVTVTLILCFFGTLREIRPSEPFVTEFLLGEWRNITEDQLNRDIYPVGISGISVYAVLLWTSSLEWLQVSQFLYGIYMATEVAYLTYIYAKVDSSKYPRVSSYTRIAALAGRFLSGVSAQLLTHFHLMNYRDLNYITLTAQILATFWAFWLPPVQFGIYFHRRNSSGINLQPNNYPLKKQHSTSPEQEKQTFRKNVIEAATLITQHARLAYTRPKVLAWSALYAIALALFVQAQTYVQLLWKQIQEESGNPVAYNGAVEATQTLLGAAGAFIASILTRASNPAPVAAVQGVAVFLGTYTTNVYVSYAGYVVMGMLFHYTITLASAKIASQLSDESCFGLIFGINTLIGTGLQSLLTLILIQTLRMSIASQYYVLSGLFLLQATGWLLGWIIQKCKHKQFVVTNQY